MSLEDMKLLPQIQCTLTPQQWILGFDRHIPFVGKKSLVSDIYPMRSGKQFVNTLEDNICRCSAMVKLISDSAKPEISHKVQYIVRAYNISDWQSEPHHQNQNMGDETIRVIHRSALKIRTLKNPNIKGLLMMERRTISSLFPSPSNIEPHCHILNSQTNLIYPNCLHQIKA